MKRALYRCIGLLLLLHGCGVDSAQQPGEVSSMTQASLTSDGFTFNGRIGGTMNGFSGNGTITYNAGGGSIRLRISNVLLNDLPNACRCNLVCPDGSLVFHAICCLNPNYVPADACQ